MKFAIEGGHRQFFRRHQALEVQGILSEKELNELNLKLQDALAVRLKTSADKIYRELPRSVFYSARDLSRENEYVKKIALNSRFAEIASELTTVRPLRFGFDQLFMTVLPALQDKESFNPYLDFMQPDMTFKERCSLRGVVCGLMICLSNENEEEGLADKETVSLFPKKAGSAVFFSPEVLFDFNPLIQDNKAKYLMIVYTKSSAIYQLEENDPGTHHMKSLGYVFGDHLSDKLNPILFR